MGKCEHNSDDVGRSWRKRRSPTKTHLFNRYKRCQASKFPDSIMPSKFQKRMNLGANASKTAKTKRKKASRTAA